MRKIVPVFLMAVATAAFADSDFYRHAHAFRSPSGNIDCIGDREWKNENRKWDGVECQMSRVLNDRPALPRPQDCDLDWGGNFSIGRAGKVEMGCVGDSISQPDSRVLRYGETLRGNGWQCTSLKTGMRCINSDGHGFDISRRRQKLF